ncbi:hypothetical protein [Hydrogenophaga luteola]|uniref:Uncharacterized protein n=1 Tax=Hydrogenophaga luteola TaxID=1591122 RepID=A0ABV7W384_9BURK
MVVWATTLLALSLAGLFALLHTAYWLVSPPLSPQAQGYEALAKALPTSTDNAYRVEGLFAPVALDSAQYGRCVHPVLQLRKDKEAEKQAGVERCNQGQAALSLPPALEQAQVSPGWTEREWLALAQAVPDQTLLARSKAIAAAGPRSFGYRLGDLSPPLRPLWTLNLWQSAHALALWRQGRTDDAVSAFESAIGDNLQSADDTLIEAMVSVRGVSQNLLALQLALASSPASDEASAQRLRHLLDAVDSMPARGFKAMDAEWATYASSFDFGELRKQLDRPGVLGWVTTALLRLMHREDTLNRLAIQFGVARQRMLMASQATTMAQSATTPMPGASPCASLGKGAIMCYGLLPNPVGRHFLDNTPLPADIYEPYGIRIADVRNLAAATRLSLEARRRGLAGQALAAFVADAPPGMRDVFTRQPFAYNPQARELTIVLRHKSPVLGEAGEYRLPL